MWRDTTCDRRSSSCICIFCSKSRAFRACEASALSQFSTYSFQPNPVSRVDMTSRSISQLLRTQMPPMARQRPLPTFPRHISLNWSRQSTAAFGLRGVSTETPASEEKVESTASTEEKAKTGAPPVAGTKEDSVAKLKEERDDLVVRLYLD